MSAEQQAARRCEGGECAGSSAGATGASPRLQQQPQHRSHLAAKVTKLLKTDLINSRNSGSATSCASRHLGFSDDVTSIPKVTLLAAIILDFDSIPCVKLASTQSGLEKHGVWEEETLPAARQASLL